MVNTGQPSRGCIRCKKRKIKCDEGRPSCAKCAKINKPCPGYEEAEGAFIHRSYMPSSARSSQSGNSNSSSSRHISTAPEGSEDIETSRRLESLSLNPGSLSNAEAPPNAPSHTSFIDNDQLRNLPSHLGSSFVEILPDMCRQVGPGSCLLEVLNAISLASYANRWKPVDFQPLLQTQYGRALQAVNKALSNPAEAVEDGTLMAVHLMGTFEFITDDCTLARSPGHGWRTHTDGTLRIFATRDPALSFTPEGRRLFLLIHIAHQLKALFFDEELPEFIVKMTIRVWQLEYRTPVISARVVTYFHQTAKLRSRAMRLLSAASVDVNRFSANMLDIVDVANVLDAEMSGWSSEDDHFKPRRVRSDQFSSQTSESYKMQAKLFYTRFEVFLHWYQYYLARIKLHESLIDGLQAISQRGNTDRHHFHGQDFQAQIQQYKEIIQCCINGFVGSIAFSLGEVSENGTVRAAASPISSQTWLHGFPQVNSETAIRLLIPLQDLTRSPHATAVQLQAINNAFERISMELRFPWAVTPRWARPEIQ